MNALYKAMLDGGYLHPKYLVASNAPHVNTNWNCDNYFLYTAQLFILCNGDVPPSTIIDWLSFDDACMIEPGLFHRFPGRTDDISQDELFGAATLQKSYASEIYRYGHNNKWCYNAESPGKFDFHYFMGRFAGFTSFIKHASGFDLDVLDQVWWSVGVLLSPWTAYGNTNGKLLQWTQFYTMSGHYKICDWAIAFWKWKMSRLYKGGLSELMSLYFGKQHPFTQFSPARF